jgi:Flp pilus assembly protein TadG
MTTNSGSYSDPQRRTERPDIVRQRRGRRCAGAGRRARRAAAAIEFALVVPLLAFLAVLAVDFARAFYSTLTLWNCARQGALYGSDPVAAQYSPYTSLSQAALADAANLSPQPTVVSSTGTDGAGNAFVSVTVSGTFSMVTDYPGVGSSFALSRTVKMRIAPTTPK